MMVLHAVGKQPVFKLMTYNDFSTKNRGRFFYEKSSGVSLKIRLTSAGQDTGYIGPPNEKRTHTAPPGLRRRQWVS
jgi:hypothetical protein